jgi:hypothetical protein
MKRARSEEGTRTGNYEVDIFCKNPEMQYTCRRNEVKII